ncbi:hypothetical protein J4448_03475 [Candidatus Woesearchaeota archaeon]|nr:hypothetical protein [Candidatus Woesearchaeota archaeon]
MNQAEAKRVISPVEAVKTHIQAVEESKMKIGDVVDLGDGEYRVGRTPVRRLGGIDYVVGFDGGVKVKAFSDGTYRINNDLYFDSEGNPIKKHGK